MNENGLLAPGPHRLNSLHDPVDVGFFRAFFANQFSHYASLPGSEAAYFFSLRMGSGWDPRPSIGSPNGTQAPGTSISKSFNDSLVQHWSLLALNEAGVTRSPAQLNISGRCRCVGCYDPFLYDCYADPSPAYLGHTTVPLYRYDACAEACAAVAGCAYWRQTELDGSSVALCTYYAAAAMPSGLPHSCDNATYAPTVFDRGSVSIGTADSHTPALQNCDVPLTTSYLGYRTVAETGAVGQCIDACANASGCLRFVLTKLPQWRDQRTCQLFNGSSAQLPSTCDASMQFDLFTVGDIGESPPS